MNRKTTELSRIDWVQAALGALAQGGIESVKVERLAKTLGVSKGSFYWHFKDRGDLLAAMLDFWAEEFTSHLIEKIAAFSTPRERLENLADESLIATVGTVDVAMAESALRSWASQDASASAFTAKVDTARIDYLVKELVLLGASGDRALSLAKGIYLALIGLFAARGSNPELAENGAFKALLAIILDDVQDKARSR